MIAFKYCLLFCEKLHKRCYIDEDLIYAKFYEFSYDQKEHTIYHYTFNKYYPKSLTGLLNVGGMLGGMLLILFCETGT